MQIKYRILSPDNLDISFFKTFYTKKEINPAIKQFVNNYKAQGYYSQICYNGYKRQIDIRDLPDYLSIIEAN